MFEVIKRERGGGGERADLFSVHNSSRVQIDVDSIPVLTNFKMIHLYTQINVRQFIDLWRVLWKGRLVAVVVEIITYIMIENFGLASISTVSILWFGRALNLIMMVLGTSPV